MDTKARTVSTVAIVVAVLAALAGIGAWFVPTGAGPGITIQGVTNFDSLTLGEDLIVGDDSTLTDDVDIDGDLDVDGTTNLDAVDVDSTVQIDGAVTVGVAGTSFDVQFFSATSGDHFLWDQSEEALTIIGTNAADALNIDDGNVDIADDMDVDGTTNLDDVDIDLSAALNIDGHVVNIGGGTPDVAAADNDLYVTADLEVDGEAEFDGTVDIDGVTNLIVGTEHIGIPSIVSTAITYTAAAGGTGAVTTIADGEIWLVHDVFVNVTTNFDCTGDDTTLVVGDGNDPDGFVTLADAELQTTDTEATGFAAGWQGLIAATQGVYIDEAAGANTFIYAPSGGAETIDWLVDEASGESITAGAATIYVVYTRIQ